jgi:hypothetical protein
MHGLLNLDHRSWALVSQPELVQLVRKVLGPACRAVDAVSMTPKATGAGLAPHRSASLFGVTLPQPECPWFIEAVWALTDYHVTLAPRSHLIRNVPRDIKKTAAAMAATSISVTVPAGSLLVQHPGLWYNEEGGEGPIVGVRVPIYPTWMNSWLDKSYQPLWPETFAAMPPVVQAMMPGLRGRVREDLYEFALPTGVRERHSL